MMNVFGRTLSAARNTNGRDHQSDHHVTVLIGRPFQGGVVGGLEAANSDYRAMSINSQSGAGVAGGAGGIPFSDTLASLGQTPAPRCGVDPGFLGPDIPRRD